MKIFKKVAMSLILILMTFFAFGQVDSVTIVDPELAYDTLTEVTHSNSQFLSRKGGQYKWGTPSMIKEFTDQSLSLSNDTLYLSDGGFVVLPSGGGAVNSVFGRTGTVTAQNGDYTASNITYVPSGDIDETDVQSALDSIWGKDLDKDAQNEIQILSISNDTIFLSNGGFVVSPTIYTGDGTITGTRTVTADGTNQLNFRDGGSGVDFLTFDPVTNNSIFDLNFVTNSNISFNLSDSETSTFTDSRTATVGLQYSADYSSGFTDRSLIDKGFLDSQIPTNNNQLTNGAGYLTSEADGSVTNEGALAVGAGNAETSEIQSNTSGDNPIVLKEGANITLTESGDTITIASSGGGGGGELSVGVAGGNSSDIESTGSTANIRLKGTGNITITEDADTITINSGGVSGSGDTDKLAYWTSPTAIGHLTGLFINPTTTQLAISSTDQFSIDVNKPIEIDGGFSTPSTTIGDGIRVSFNNNTNPFGIGLGAIGGNGIPMTFQVGSNGDGFEFWEYNNLSALIDGDGNFGVGLSTPAARIHAKGEGATSSTFSFQAENSAGALGFRVRDDGAVIVPTRAGTGIYLAGFSTDSVLVDLTLGDNITLSADTIEAKVIQTYSATDFSNTTAVDNLGNTQTRIFSSEIEGGEITEFTFKATSYISGTLSVRLHKNGTPIGTAFSVTNTNIYKQTLTESIGADEYITVVYTGTHSVQGAHWTVTAVK